MKPQKSPGQVTQKLKRIKEKESQKFFTGVEEQKSKKAKTTGTQNI